MDINTYIITFSKLDTRNVLKHQIVLPRLRSTYSLFQHPSCSADTKSPTGAWKKLFSLYIPSSVVWCMADDVFITVHCMSGVVRDELDVKYLQGCLVIITLYFIMYGCYCYTCNIQITELWRIDIISCLLKIIGLYLNQNSSASTYIIIIETQELRWNTCLYDNGELVRVPVCVSMYVTNFFCGFQNR